LFRPDAIQKLAFELCHVYARATRSVSIPAPVYYADIVCARAKIHYDPNAGLELSDFATELSSTEARNNQDVFKQNYKRVHNNTSRMMYFS